MNRRAIRLAAFSFLLPVPVALAAPLSSTLPAETLQAMSQVPVRGVGDTVLPRVLPLPGKASGKKLDPAASVTKLDKVSKSRKQVRAEASAIAENGIPAAALRAYRTAEATMNIADPSCGLSWGLLAGIGRIESDHGRYGGATLANNGVSTPHILGLPLNGAGAVSAIADTDHGTLDGDRKWDRAVGPMQFIPSTWALVGVDGDGNGKRNPHDIDDAALAAAAYLCVGDNDLTTPTGMHDAVYSYNHSEDYVALVLGVAHAYQSGIVDLPLLTATLTLPTGPGTAVGLTPGHGVAIGATDEVTKAGGKKGDDAKDAKQTKPGAADPGKVGKLGKLGKNADRTAGDGAGGKAGDKTRTPTGGGKQKPPAGEDPVDKTPSAGGDKPGKGGGTEPPSTEPPGGGDGTTEPTDPPTEKPEPSDPPTTEPTEPPEPTADVAEGTLVWCDEEAQDALCLDSPDNPLDVDVDTYKSLVEKPVTVIYDSTDGTLSGAICDIVEGKVDDPEC